MSRPPGRRHNGPLADNPVNRNSPFVVGVSGHRDLHPDTLEPLRREVTRFLEALKSLLPDTELRIMAGMAAGADLLVVAQRST